MVRLGDIIIIIIYFKKYIFDSLIILKFTDTKTSKIILLGLPIIGI